MPVSKNTRKRKSIRQSIQLNVLRTPKVYKVDKEIKVQPKGRPNRLDFSNDQEGKRLYRELRDKFVEENPMVVKRVMRTTTRIRVSVHPDLNDLYNRPERVQGIKDLQESCNDIDPGKRRSTVVSSIRLEKTKNKLKHITHGSTKRKNEKGRIQPIESSGLLRSLRKNNSTGFEAINLGYNTPKAA